MNDRQFRESLDRWLTTEPRDDDDYPEQCPGPCSVCGPEGCNPACDPCNAERAAYDAHSAAEWERHERECGAQFVTAGPDPYGTHCDRDKHPGDPRHEGADPMAMPSDHSRIEWEDAGGTGRFPYRNIKRVERAECVTCPPGACPGPDCPGSLDRPETGQ